MSEGEEIKSAIENLSALKAKAAPTHDSEADLIATLRRTIDAQLAILREVDFQLSGNPEHVTFSGHEYNLFVALARAVNGVQYRKGETE